MTRFRFTVHKFVITFHGQNSPGIHEAINRSSGGMPEAITKVGHFNDKVTLLQSLDEQSKRRKLLKGNGRRR